VEEGGRGGWLAGAICCGGWHGHLTSFVDKAPLCEKDGKGELLPDPSLCPPQRFQKPARRKKKEDAQRQ